MDPKTVTHLIALAAVISLSAEELFIIPRNTESRVGDTTYFNCSTNLQSREIFWNHGRNYIYTGVAIINPYRGRFEIDRNASNGSHNLVIHSVQPGDAGEYICIDDDGHGTKRSAELVVLDNDPECVSNTQPDGVIGQNIFKIEPDEVQLTCNVTYYGNIPPRMEWKKAGENKSIKDNVTNIGSHNRLLYTLNLTGDISLEKSSYICQTTRSTQNQYMCTSEIIEALYFLGGTMTEQSVVIGEMITCITKNNTFSCNNQWYIGNKSCPLSCDENITAHVLGEYLCTVKCHIRGKDYYFEALKAVVADVATSPPPSNSGKIAASVLVPIVIIILVVIIAVSIVRRNKKMDKQNILRQIGQLRSEEQRIEWLLSMNSIHNRPDDINSRFAFDDDVAEEEIELLYKIKREDTDEARPIIGVAILCEQLFLAREESPHLEVYDRNAFSQAYIILNVKVIVSAIDICSCSRNVCLYVMNKKDDGAQMEVIKIGTEGKLLKNWPTKDNAKGHVSATAEGNVIIAVQDKHVLLEYSSDGELMRNIELSGLINPWHAIKVDGGHYIVSHGMLFDRLHRICRVGEEGKVENSFGREIGSTEKQLNIPFYLGVGTNGCVMVADLCNNRVLLLDSNLNFKTKIVPKFRQRFRSPRRIYLDKELLVVVIGEGVPQRRIRIKKHDSMEETEPVRILEENDSSVELRQEEPHCSMTEIKERATRTGIDDPKNIMQLHGNVVIEYTGEDDLLLENEDPKDTMHEEEHDTKKETEEAIPLKEIRVHKETTNAEEIDDEDEREAAEYLKFLRERKKYTREVDVSHRIEEDCRLLIFNIQPLLQKYDD